MKKMKKIISHSVWIWSIFQLRVGNLWSGLVVFCWGEKKKDSETHKQGDTTLPRINVTLLAPFLSMILLLNRKRNLKEGGVSWTLLGSHVFRNRSFYLESTKLKHNG